MGVRSDELIDIGSYLAQKVFERLLFGSAQARESAVNAGKKRREQLAHEAPSRRRDAQFDAPAVFVA
jgi:hypothetical protein